MATEKHYMKCKKFRFSFGDHRTKTQTFYSQKIKERNTYSYHKFSENLENLLEKFICKTAGNLSQSPSALDNVINANNKKKRKSYER
jgi:hypothetical protein